MGARSSCETAETKLLFSLVKLLLAAKGPPSGEEARQHRRH